MASGETTIGKEKPALGIRNRVLPFGLSIGDRGLRRWVVTVVTLVIILLWLNNVLYFWPEVMDDAFITFRHSLNAAEGRGLVYNPPERSEGHSSPVWALLHIVPFLWDWDVILFSKVAGFLLGSAGIVVTVLYSRRVGLRYPMVGALVLAVWTPVGYWSVTGMETPLAFLISIAAVYVHRLEVDSGRRIWFTALLLAVGFFVHPEAGLIAVPVIVQHVLVLWPDWRRGLRLAFWPGALCCALVAWGTSLRFAYYGSILANPTLVKMFGWGGEPEDLRGFQYILGLFVYRPSVMALLLMATVPAFLKHGRTTAVAYTSAICWVFFGYLANGDWMPNFRLLVPATPFLAVIVACGVDGAFSLGSRRKRWIPASAILLGLGWFVVSESGYATIRNDREGNSVEMRVPRIALLHPEQYLRSGLELGSQYIMKEVMRTVPADGTIACYDIGFVGFCRPDATVLDMVGLGDRRMAEMMATGRLVGEFMSYFLERNPDVVFIYRSKLGGGFFKTDRILLENRHFTEGWTSRKQMQVWAGQLDIYIRKDLPTEQPVRQQVQACQRLVDLMPRWPPARVEYGLALAAAGEREGARKAMLQVIECFPANVRANVLAARYFRDVGEFETSYLGFRNAARYSVLGWGGQYNYVYPGNEYVFEEYLASLSRLKRYEEAIKAGERFVEVVEDYPPVQWQISYACAALGRKEAGLEYLKSAALSERTDGKSRSVAGRAAEELGDSYLQAGDRSEARRWYETAVRQYPDASARDRVTKRLVDIERH